MDTAPTHESEVLRRVRRGARLIALVGMVQIMSNIHFLFANFGEQFLERGITLEQVGVTKAQIHAFNPDLLNYISHLHIAVAGYGMALGLAVAALAWFGIQRGLPWAWWTAVASVFTAAVVGLPAHFFYDLATVGHLGPPFALLAVFAVGAAMSYPTSAPARGLEGVRRIQPPELPDSRPSGFTQVVAVHGKTLVFVSGQVAVDRDGRLVGQGDIVAQTHQVMKNVEAALRSASATFENVVKLTIYVVDYKPSDRARILEVRRQYIAPGNLPASTLVGVPALAAEGFLIEVEAVAAIP